MNLNRSSSLKPVPTCNRINTETIDSPRNQEHPSARFSTVEGGVNSGWADPIHYCKRNSYLANTLKFVPLRVVTGHQICTVDIDSFALRKYRKFNVRYNKGRIPVGARLATATSTSWRFKNCCGSHDINETNRCKGNSCVNESHLAPVPANHHQVYRVANTHTINIVLQTIY